MPENYIKNFIRCRLCDMNGDITKQWYVYYSFRNPETNKLELHKKYISKRCKLKMHRYNIAKEIINKYNEMLECGYNPYEQYKCLTIKEAFEFLERYRKNKTDKLKTVQTDRYVIKKFMRFLQTKNLKSIRLEEFSKKNAQDYFDWLLIEEELSNRTCNNHLLFLRTYFNEFLRREYITKNVFSGIKKLNQKDATIVAYTKEQIEIIKNRLPAYDSDLWAFISFIYYASMRTIEITRLQRKNIDIDNNIILIDSTISKTLKQQVIRITERLKSVIIASEFDKLPMDYYLFSHKMKPGTDYVGATGVQKRWRKFASISGMKGCHMYWLKHTANGHALDKGVSVKDIQTHNRHHSLDQTMMYLNRFRNLASDKINLLDAL
jgi:integrase